MNPISRIIIAAFATMWAAAALAAGPSYQIGVVGLACPVCADNLERQLRTVDGVQHVEVRLSEDVVVITMKDGATLDTSAADKVITDAGFSVNQRANMLPCEFE